MSKKQMAGLSSMVVGVVWVGILRVVHGHVAANTVVKEKSGLGYQLAVGCGMMSDNTQ